MTEFKKGVNEVKETKDEIVKDVNKIKTDIVNEAKDAAGLNESEDDDSD